MKAYEVNFDGLVGPTHNYAGLSFGNVASERHLKEVSNPKEAAKQGLKKMKTMADMGFKQGVIMPQQRPDLTVLRQLGFSGTDVQVIDKAAKCEPRLLAAVYSASSMWTANAATVSPSADTLDAKVHLTAANLNAKLHRSIEHETTSRILKGMFADCDYFTHHQALPPIAEFGDEGAANHTRFCHDYGKQGVELFVYGQQAFNPNAPKPLRYPARQTLEACQAIARLHGLDENYVVYAQQKPATIDAGVFHNDVISVGNRDVFFYHELAFDEPQKVIDQISSKLPENNLRGICVKASEVSLKDAVDSYLFNSQLLSLDNETMLLVVPEECREIRVVSDYLDDLVQSSHPIQSVETFDLKQSMKNGGGPACLRLRVVLKENELAAVNQGVLMNDALFDSLNTWVDKHYRDRFSARDMADFTLIKEVQTALDELTGILGMPSIYPFQSP